MKKKYDIIKLKFSSPLHLSKGLSDYASSYNTLHSDTLKSAIFSAAIELGLPVDSSNYVHDDLSGQNDFLQSFKVSSAFPFYKAEYFFPKPTSEFQKVHHSGKEIKKGQKAIEFLGKSLFEEVLTGTSVQVVNGAKKFSTAIDSTEDLFPYGKIDSKATDFKQGAFASKSISKTTQQANFYIMAKEVMMRVSVPRHAGGDEDARPYYVERIYFPEEGGLYFFIEANAETKQTISYILDILGDTGLGTDKNTGNGQFSYEWDTLELDVPEQSSHQTLLSLFLPKETEIKGIDLDQSAYSLIKRGGYIANPQTDYGLMSHRKKSIYMFEEGAIFAAQKLQGNLVDLKPTGQGVTCTHPIWRDGTAFSLPINPIWNE